MKVLLLGNGIATRGCKRLLDKHLINNEILEIEDVKEYDYDLVVKSPGIPLDIEIFSNFKCEIISDIELGYRLVKPRIIAVTGSNGKTTVVSLLQHVLSKKYKTIACGNIGYSFCDALVDYPKYDYYILECSSYQLEAIKSFNPEIFILLNISLCHIDHHKSLNNYVNAKLKTVSILGRNCVFIYNDKIPYVKADNYDCKKISFSDLKTSSSVYRLKNRVYFRNELIYKIDSNRSKMSYKCENIMAVLSVLYALNELKLKKYIKEFKGVQFRLEKIDKEVYNDAKSTNCESTRVALTALNNVHLICGGYDRGIPIILDSLSISHVKHVYAYGETSKLIKDFFDEYDIPCNIFITLDEAFLSAVMNKKKRENLLYSPMFASLDQYSSYIERGMEFNELHNDYKRKL
ncbi:MAG: UDP-N-acetylmuramoyl-L-alanine--D-glutamate ligase [Acholeplasmatales bacterium]|nr:UDP-N-acetylmuramoyl-L-alanine--D-glutamate ligase [Acholeplasmatales bacterium]